MHVGRTIYNTEFGRVGSKLGDVGFGSIELFSKVIESGNDKTPKA